MTRKIIGLALFAPALIVLMSMIGCNSETPLVVKQGDHVTTYRVQGMM